MREGFILRAIAGEMQAGVLALGAKGVVLYANPFFLKSFPAEGGVEGRSVSDIIKDGALLKAVGRLLKSRTRRAEDIELSERGAFFKVHMVPIVETGATGGRCLLLFLQDITEEKKVETIKKDFVANVSHELRTPLASIKGYAETLLDGAMEERESLKEFLRVIDRHATRMSRLIDDLLVLSRLESHELPMVMSQVDMKELVSGAVKGLEKQAGDKGIRLSVSIPDGLAKALGDRDRLEQVVVNLLDNAIKYTPSGGSVLAAASSADDGVRVEVRDTGIGIPESDIPRIFERFYRVDKARSRELGGTGLGLAIVKHIIQGHGGRLRVESAPGKGSAFSFVVRAAR